MAREREHGSGKNLPPADQVHDSSMLKQALLNIFRGKFTLGFFRGHKVQLMQGCSSAEKPRSSERDYVSHTEPRVLGGVIYAEGLDFEFQKLMRRYLLLI